MKSDKIFETLIEEINQIENKIDEVKETGNFYQAKLFLISLNSIKENAKNIFVDDNPYDILQVKEPLTLLIKLDSEIDYYLMKTSNFIEIQTYKDDKLSTIKQIRNKWEMINNEYKAWSSQEHNPIEYIEKEKYFGNIVLDILIEQISKEGILNLTSALKIITVQNLINNLKTILFDGAEKSVLNEDKSKYIELARNLDEKEILNYKLWLEILAIRGINFKYNKIDIIYNNIIKEDKNNYQEVENTGLPFIIDDTNISIIDVIKNKIMQYIEMHHQYRMEKNWGINGKSPAFKNILIDDTINYEHNFINKNIIEKTKELFICSSTVTKYNFAQTATWFYLKKINFPRINARISHSKGDVSYNYIANNTFADCEALEEIDFGKIELIGERAFKNCEQLRSLRFSNNIKSIGKDAFKNCTNLTLVEFEDDLEKYILDRPQTVLECFKGTNLKEILFPKFSTCFNYAIVDCPNLKNIYVKDFDLMSIPFRTCKYVLGEREGIVSFVNRTALELWKKKNRNVRFYEIEN